MYSQSVTESWTCIQAIASEWYLVKSSRRARSQITPTGCFALDAVPWNGVKQHKVLFANLLVVDQDGAHMLFLVLNDIKTRLATNPESMS